MIKSIAQLYKHPFNRENPFFALYRWFEWKFIRLLKLKNYKKKVWGDRILLLNHDSFQSMWIMYNWIVDWEEFNFIKDYLYPEDLVFDVGANMGFYTIWFSKYISDTGKVYSFEPDEKSIKRLENNIKINNLGNIVKANNLALSDLVGDLTFTIGLDGKNHICDSTREQSVFITSTTLDLYAKENDINEIAYCKIDVEGFELNVLKGANRLLSNRKISVIQLEINQQIQHSGAELAQLLQYLSAYGYSLYGYDVSSKVLIPVQYDSLRENYFAIAEIEKVASRISRSK